MHATVTMWPRRAVSVGLLSAGIASSVALSAHIAQAQPTMIPGITVLSIVRWHGTDCIPARTADGERDLCNTVTQPPE